MIGAALKLLLNERGISVSEFARRSGIGVQTLYSMIKRDSANVDLGILIKICMALNMPFESFFRACYPHYELPLFPQEAASEILNGYLRLDEHGREIIGVILEIELSRITSESKRGF